MVKSDVARQLRDIERGTPLRIVWEDAAADPNTSWSEHDCVALDLPRVCSVGHLLATSRRAVVLAGDWREDADVVHMTSRIPIGCIVSVEVLSP